jgi:hypothetical protein
MSLFAAGVCFAETISVSSVAASSSFGSYVPGRLVDGSGLANDVHNTTWQNMWMTVAGDAGWLEFDLGGTFRLSEMEIWNYNANINGDSAYVGRGVDTFAIYTSLDGVAYTLLSTESLSQAPGTASVAGEMIALGGVDARYVQLDLLTNHGGYLGDYYGLSEVQFTGAPVPEPSSLVFGGLAALGWLLAGRRSRPGALSPEHKEGAAR